MTRSIKTQLTYAFALVAMAGLSSMPIAMAAPSVKAAHGKKAPSHAAYVCKACKAFCTPLAAKKMGYKDGMGHPLTRVKKTPAGYMDGSKMKM